MWICVGSGTVYYTYMHENEETTIGKCSEQCSVRKLQTVCIHSALLHTYLEERQEQELVLQSSLQKALVALLEEYFHMFSVPPKQST